MASSASLPRNPTDGRILVVGASGQLGHALLHALGTQALAAARRPQNRHWLRLDLQESASDPASLDPLTQTGDIAAVICAAGATDVERCEADLAWAEAANRRGPVALAKAFRSVPFVFLSTDYVFDGRHPDAPLDEDAPTRPLSAYGRTKLAGEKGVLEAHPTALVVRTTTVYGPDPQEKNFLYTLRRLLGEGKTMRVPADQFATPTYNEDLARAILYLLGRGARGIFHVAGPEFMSRYDFALQASSLLHLDPARIQPVSTAELQQKAARPLRAGLRTDKLNAALGESIMRAPRAGIAAWMQHLNQPAGVST